MPMDSTVDRPLYLRVREELKCRIESGQYDLGTNLPTESQLCDSFGASRHTVREALRGLVQLGLIERKQGAGSVVVAHATPTTFKHSVKSLSELWSYSKATKIFVNRLATVRLDAKEAAIVEAPAGSRWLKVDAERWTADESEILCWLVLYAHVRFAKIIKDIGTSTDPVYATIEAKSGEQVTEAVQEISACGLPQEAADALGRKRGEPGLRVVRRYLDASGKPMLVATSIHPSDAFTHTLRLRREGDAS
jgi:GntR family transcriptional regulator